VPSTRAAILCGGRGERLKPLTDYFQKVMIPVGPKKAPLLEYILALDRHHGITKVSLLTGYRSEDIRRYFGDGSGHGVELTYSEDQRGARGSLNALANALRSKGLAGCDELLVYYGDVLTDLDITSLLVRHRRSRAQVTLVLDRGYALPVGVARVKRGFVTSFEEKPRMEINVTTGMMVLGPEAMTRAGSLAGPRKTDLMTDFVPEILAGGGRVGAFYNDRRWFDVGTFSTLEKLDEELNRHPPSFMA